MPRAHISSRRVILNKLFDDVQRYLALWDDKVAQNLSLVPSKEMDF